MESFIFMFPGQGSQYVGMMEDFYRNDDRTKKMLREVENVLNFPLGYTMFNGPEEGLTRTLYTQPAIFVHSASICAILRESGIEPYVALGHSLGEVTALFAAGALNFSDAVRVVAKRAEVMDNVYERGAMSAVIGLDIEKIEEVLKPFGRRVVIANINSPSQVVVSGLLADMEVVEEKLKEQGARKVIRLNVSNAFHSPLMEPAQREFAEFIEDIKFETPKAPVIPNAEPGLETNPIVLKELLIKQMCSTVNWVESIRIAGKIRSGVFLEVGPKRTLGRFLREILGDVPYISIDTYQDLLNFLDQAKS
ncbi:MAG TPA: ACP S-malonyltransferase [Candidatus Hydrothermia bacterium]|nr:ACP S-malonyltransferase [Candidatus Hydrothermae bacterium]HRD23042.1 ACP S-malonyltransferase [Candidatus Hydrothermia bacterium]